jgi:uncharacterized protein YjdB
MNTKKVTALSLSLLLLFESPFAVQAKKVETQNPVVANVAEESVAFKPEIQDEQEKQTVAKEQNLNGEKESLNDQGLVDEQESLNDQGLVDEQESLNDEGLIRSQDPTNDQDLQMTSEDIPLSPKAEQGDQNTSETPDESEEEQPGEEQSDITLDCNEKTLIAGDSYQLKAQSQSNLAITFTSSNPEVASVTAEGLITAISIGTCLITAENENGKAVCNITVQGELSISETQVRLYRGQTHTLKASLRPQSTVIWSSNNTSVATVSQAGVVTALKQGTAVISATANNLTVNCVITVSEPTLKLNATKLTAYIGFKTTLKATAVPKATTVFKSSNTKIATVSTTGVITPKKKGTVKITATSNGISATCTITVKASSLTLAEKQYVFTGNSEYLVFKAAPSKGLTWKSSNPKIVSVAKNGIMTGHKVGKATITVTNGKVRRSCVVQVFKNNYAFNKKNVTLTKGDSIQVYMKNLKANEVAGYEIFEGDKKSVKISKKGNVCTINALRSGTVTVRSTYIYNLGTRLVACYNTITIKVEDVGISPRMGAVAAGKTKSYVLRAENTGKTVQSVSWSSSNPAVAAINAGSGLLAAKKSGTAKISAKVVYTDGRSLTYATNVKVSNPKIGTTTKISSSSAGYKINLTGITDYSNISWKSSRTASAQVAPNGSVIIKTDKPQKVKFTATVDGKNVVQTLIITNPKLKIHYKLLTRGKGAKILLNGINKKSKVTFKSLSKSIATVTKTGFIRAKKNGNAKILVTADGRKMEFTVHVVSKKILNSVLKAESIMYSSTYSQAYRMSLGYYDCSSLTYRAFQPNADSILGAGPWAPTAAAQAYYLVSKGKIISYKGLDTSQLRPGDLLFYGGANNGRYRGIYHISIYYGGGYRLEKPFRAYDQNDPNLVMIARPVK